MIASWKEAMTNVDSVLKSKYITLPIKVHIVRTMAFPVVKYGCESGTKKKTEHWRTDAFELWCWRRLLRVTLKGNQPWILIGRIDCKVDAPVFCTLDMNSQLTEQDPDAGK